MHLATTLLLSNPLPPTPPPPKKGELYRFKSAIDTLLRVPISSPEAVLLPRQADQSILALDVNDLGDLAGFQCLSSQQDELFCSHSFLIADVVVCTSELCNTSMLQLKELLLIRTFCKQKFDLAYEILRNVTTFEVR